MNQKDDKDGIYSGGDIDNTFYRHWEKEKKKKKKKDGKEDDDDEEEVELDEHELCRIHAMVQRLRRKGASYEEAWEKANERIEKMKEVKR